MSSHPSSAEPQPWPEFCNLLKNNWGPWRDWMSLIVGHWLCRCHSRLGRLNSLGQARCGMGKTRVWFIFQHWGDSGDIASLASAGKLQPGLWRRGGGSSPVSGTA